MKVDSLLYIDGTTWGQNLSELNSSIDQTAVQNVLVDDNQWKSMLICPLPESLSVISTVSNAEVDMKFEGLDA